MKQQVPLSHLMQRFFFTLLFSDLCCLTPHYMKGQVEETAALADVIGVYDGRSTADER